METIFDFNPTPEEIKRYSPYSDKAEYLDYNSKKSRLTDLGFLFHNRNNFKKRDEYINQLDDISQADFFRIVNHY